MSGLPAILGNLKVDIGIKNRKKMKKINHRHQYLNPIGDFFEIPENCKKLHKKENKKFQCNLVMLDEVTKFRSQLYSSIERKDQDEFISNVVKAVSAKSHRTSMLQVARMVTLFYYFPKSSGEKIPICKEMFRAVSGMPEGRTRGIFKKLYKNQLLTEGDSDLKKISSGKLSEHEEKVQEMLIAKKEKLLSLEKGTYESFAKAVLGDQKEESPEKKSQVKNDRREIETNNLESDEIIIEEDEHVRVWLDLDDLDVCRICLLNDGNLMPLSDRLANEDCTVSELLNYCLPIEALESAKTMDCPDKICTACLGSLQIAAKLRSDYLESTNIMKNCLIERKEPEIEENSGPLVDYLYNNQFELPEEHLIEEDVVLEEEVVMTEEPPKEESPYSGMRPKKCYLCDCDFDSTPEEHFSTVHNLIEITRCTKCEFETEFPWFLNLHYQVHEDDFKLCPFCGKKFESNSTKFSSHKSRCNGNRKNIGKKFSCELCSATYSKPGSVREHYRLAHTNEKPYVCSDCKEKFATRIALRRHLMKHGIGANCFCSGCGKGYLQRYELVRHEKFCLKQ